MARTKKNQKPAYEPLPTEYVPGPWSGVDMIKVIQILADLYGEQTGVKITVTGRRKTPEEMEEMFRKNAELNAQAEAAMKAAGAEGT